MKKVYTMLTAVVLAVAMLVVGSNRVWAAATDNVQLNITISGASLAVNVVPDASFNFGTLAIGAVITADQSTSISVNNISGSQDNNTGLTQTYNLSANHLGPSGWALGSTVGVNAYRVALVFSDAGVGAPAGAEFDVGGYATDDVVSDASAKAATNTIFCGSACYSTGATATRNSGLSVPPGDGAERTLWTRIEAPTSSSLATTTLSFNLNVNATAG